MFCFSLNIAKINNIADSVIFRRKLLGYPDLDYNMPGIVISTWAKDRGFSYEVAKGKADLSTGRALKVNDLFRIGSITKTFGITVMLQLVDEGKVSLGDKLIWIGHYEFPGFRGTGRRYYGIPYLYDL